MKAAAGALLGGAALSALVFFTAPTVFEATDFVRLHRLNRHYAGARLAEGGLPLWNPHVNLGRPFLADIETGVFYPPNAVHLALDPVSGLALLAVVHSALAIFGMRAFCLRLGAASVPAWAAGVVWASAASFVEPMLAGQVPYTWGTAYLPLAFLAARAAQDERTFAAAARLAAVLGLQLLAGHPQISWITVFGLGWFALGRVAMEGGPRAALRGLAVLVLGLAWALALAAVQLLPSAELASQGNRSRSFAFAAAGAMRAADWASLVRVPGSSEEYRLYVGMAALVAGCCGLAAPSDRDRRGLFLVAAAGALFAAGAATPFFQLVYWAVPGAAWLRIPSRAGVLVVFALVSAAGAYMSSPRASPRWLLPVAAVLAVAAAIAGHAVLPPSPRPAAWAVALAAAASVALGAWRSAGPHRRALAGAALAGLTLLDLGTALAAHKSTLSRPDDLRAEPSVARALVAAGLVDGTGVPPRVSVPYWIARDNAGLVHGYSTFTGYVSLTLGRVWAYVHDVLGIPRPESDNTYPSAAIYARGPFPYDTMNLRLGADPATGALVVRPRPDPRAYLVGRARAVGDWGEALRLLVAGHDPHAEALLEQPLDLPAAPVAATGAAAITRFAPEEVTVLVDAPAPALLVLAEAWFPGWEATIAGRAVPCVPANVWMRAVPVPAGRSEVRFRFRSRYLAAGAAVSLAALAALGVTLARSARRGER